MKVQAKRLLLWVALAALSSSVVLAATLFFQGFEIDTSGWFASGGDSITRVASGYVSSGYASGIDSATGGFHARLGLDPTPTTCTYGGGTASIFAGPFTQWGGYNSVFPTGGYQTYVDIYLDVSYAQAHPDTRFDWSSAINDAAGNFRRDFVFNVGTDAAGFVITAGNNSNRCGADPSSGAPPRVSITTSGWYTFEHSFTGTLGGPLSVILTVTQKGTSTVMGTWIRSDPTDIIGTTVGGNRSGSFPQNEFPELAIDNSRRDGPAVTPTSKDQCKDSGWQTFNPTFKNQGDCISFFLHS